MRYICEFCGNEFAPNTHGNAKNEFCSTNCRKRWWDDQTKPTCQCGAAIARGSTHCLECGFGLRALSRDARRVLIKRLWDEGLTMAEIAERDDVPYNSVSSLGVELHRMKADGWEIENRRPGWRGHSKHPGPPKVLKAVYTSQEASRRVRHALTQGDLVKPSECEWCGTNGLLEAHHHDYSKPLDVEWICRKCHASHHAEKIRKHPARKPERNEDIVA